VPAAQSELMHRLLDDAYIVFTFISGSQILKRFDGFPKLEHLFPIAGSKGRKQLEG